MVFNDEKFSREFPKFAKPLSVKFLLLLKLTKEIMLKLKYFQKFKESEFNFERLLRDFPKFDNPLSVKFLLLLKCLNVYYKV